MFNYEFVDPSKYFLIILQNKKWCNPTTSLLAGGFLDLTHRLTSRFLGGFNKIIFFIQFYYFFNSCIRKTGSNLIYVSKPLDVGRKEGGTNLDSI